MAATGWFMLIGDGPRDVVIDHNTVSHSGTSFVFLYGGTSADPREMYSVRITNNAARHSSYGINGDYFGYGNGVINGFLPGGTVTGNYLAGGSASRYPPGNRFAGAFDAEFVSAAAGDFHLRVNQYAARRGHRRRRYRRARSGRCWATTPTVEAGYLQGVAAPAARQRPHPSVSSARSRRREAPTRAV